MNRTTFDGLWNELEKIALRAGVRLIQQLMAKGTPEAIAQANRLAKTPGVVKSTAMGSQIKHLGRGGEGIADLVAHPQHGVSVRKLYDPTSGIASPTMISRKLQMAKQVESPLMAQTHGFARSSRGGRASFHEYVPGGMPTEQTERAIQSQLRSAGAKKGYQLEDIRDVNIRGGKAIDVLPFHGGEVAATRGGDIALSPKARTLSRAMDKAMSRAPGGLSTKNLYRTIGGPAKGQTLQQVRTAPTRAPIQLSPGSVTTSSRVTTPTAVAGPTPKPPKMPNAVPTQILPKPTLPPTPG